MNTNQNGRRTRVLIVGGGIAGMTAAIALHKAGLTPEVFEAYARSADGVGAFLTLAVNGIEALRAIDVEVDGLGGFATPRMELYLGNGQLLTGFDFGTPGASGLVARTIRRADLYAALRREGDRRGIAVRYGKELASATPRADGVVARFADGSEAEGDLLVGADGLRSRVRRIIDPNAPNARYVGLLNAGGYCRGVRVPGEVGTLRLYFGKHSFFGYVPSPDGDIWWFANPARRQEPTPAELRALTTQAWRAELLALFAADVTPARAIIEGTADIFAGWPTYDFPKVPIWHRDRMLIIGDAAHATSPSSGQGASMAIEDGVVLAKALRDAPDVAGACASYESARRERVERVVAEGKKSGDGKTPGAFGRVVRDTALRLIFSGKARRNPWRFLDERRIDWTSPLVEAR